MRRSSPYRHPIATLALMLVGTAFLGGAEPALAFQADPGSASLEIAPSLRQTRFVDDPAAIDANPAARSYASTLQALLGPGWRISSWNPYARAPRSVVGHGIVVAENGLADATGDQVGALARRFIQEHAALFGTDGSDLVVSRVAHGAGRWGVILHQRVGGVRVQETQVVLAIHDNGRLFAFGAALYHDVDVPLVPSIDIDQATAIARASVPFDATVDLRPATPDLVVVPIHAAPDRVEYHLAHVTDVPTREPFGLWRTWVDAHSGEILYRDNRVEHAYEGSAQGDVEIYSYCDGPTPATPYAHMFIDIDNVGTATTDASGAFSIAGDAGVQSFAAQFDGPDFDVNCIECGGDALLTGSIAPDTPIVVDFDAAGYRADERDVFYFANFTKDYIEAIDPAFALAKYTANVNIDQTCNANWQGTVINFFRAGGGCANTGEIGDVVAHELGHGIQDWATGGGQGPEGLGEGNSDITATFITDVPEIGLGFQDCGFGIRNCDNTLQYPDDLGGGSHSDGRIICGFNWDVREELTATMGASDAKDHTAVLWHFARALYMDNSNNQQDQVERYFWVDDDDGNLGNGTPNYDALCAAASAHGYACEASPNSIIIEHTPLTDTLDPGPYAIAATITTYVDGVPQVPDVNQLWYAIDGGPFGLVDMTNAGGNLWTATIPEQTPGSAVAYYLLVHDTASGLEAASPPEAPDSFHVFANGTFATLIDNPMETDEGYVVGSPEDTATEGIWEREDPVGVLGGTWQPEDDHTAEGTDCWITGNPPPGAPPFQDELDGRTSFATPTMDLDGVHMIQGSFWYWTKIGTPHPENYLELRMSNDGGASWTTIARIGEETTPEWAQHSFRVTPWQVACTDQVQFQFAAQDGNPTQMEALVDDWIVEEMSAATTAIGPVTPAEAPPAALALGPAIPNPFNPATDLRFTLPSAATVDLTIYDVHGRQVRSLVAGRREAGEHRVRWDGTAGGGRPLASGIYYARLSVGDWTSTRRLVLVK